MITYLLIGLLALAVVAFMSYFFAINLIYKKLNKKSIGIFNTFPFEVVPQKRTDRFFINSLYYIGLLAIVASSVIFTVKYFSVLTVVMSVAVAFVSLFASVIPLTSFNSLKKHLYLDVGMVILSFLFNGLVTYLSFSISKLFDFQNAVGIICIVIGGLLLIPSFYFIFNPRLFNLANEINDDVISRPKYIPLAFAEWIIPLLSAIGIVVLTMLSSILSL